MELNPLKWPISFTMSILANILYYGLLIPSALLFPGYTIFTEAVSSLGAVYDNPRGWILFSIALILIGITFIPYYYGMNVWLKETPEIKTKIRIVQVLGLVDAISMGLIAIFPTDVVHEPHFIFSMLNFIFIVLTIITLVNTLWDHPGFDKRIGYYGIMAATIIDIYFLEHLCFPIALVFSLLVGVKILLNER